MPFSNVSFLALLDSFHVQRSDLLRLAAVSFQALLYPSRGQQFGSFKVLAALHLVRCFPYTLNLIHTCYWLFIVSYLVRTLTNLVPGVLSEPESYLVVNLSRDYFITKAKLLTQLSFFKSVPVPSYEWPRGSGLGTRTGSTVTGILVPVILVLRTNFFVENFGPPGPVF